MIMTVKSWPFEFVDNTTRRFIAREWFRPGDGIYDEVEQTAANLARIEGVEVDIIGCTVFPSGRIADRERIGIRVLP